VRIKTVHLSCEKCCARASTPEKAIILIELGFKYECEFENVKLFKKPKNSGVGVLIGGAGELHLFKTAKKAVLGICFYY
jgi:hypothetical protein